jgi:hypothetical protein
MWVKKRSSLPIKLVARAQSPCSSPERCEPPFPDSAGENGRPSTFP